MFSHSTIITCLADLIGFDQGYSADTPDMDPDLTTSESGLYVNASLHPLLTPDNITACCEQFERVNVRAWNGTRTYRAGEVVAAGSDAFRSVQDGNMGHPTTDASWWAKTTLLSAYLRRVYEGSCTKLLSRLFSEKKIQESIKTLLGVGNLYEGVGNIQGRITKQGRIVGYKLRLHHADTVAVLSYIGLQLDTAQNPLTVYLYHTSSDVPLKTWSLNHTKSVAFQWHSITQELLMALSEEVNAGGSYYVCYYEDELSGEAIKKDISFAGKYGCATCSEATTNVRLYQRWSKFLAVQPFYVPSAYVNADHSLWNEEAEIYVEDTTWGMNLQFHIQCDVTRVLCQTRATLADALSRQLVVDLLHDMAYSLRDNQNKQKVSMLAAAALDPAQEGSQLSQVRELNKAIKAVSFDFSNLSPVCLPCDNQQRSRIKTIWG